MRAVAVDDVEADQQRNAEPRLLDGDALHLVHGPGADQVEQVADRAVRMDSVESPAMHRAGDR